MRPWNSIWLWRKRWVYNRDSNEALKLYSFKTEEQRRPLNWIKILIRMNTMVALALHRLHHGSRNVLDKLVAVSLPPKRKLVLREYIQPICIRVRKSRWWTKILTSADMNGNRDKHASGIQLDGQLSAKSVGYSVHRIAEPLNLLTDVVTDVYSSTSDSRFKFAIPSDCPIRHSSAKTSSLAAMFMWTWFGEPLGTI